MHFRERHQIFRYFFINWICVEFSSFLQEKEPAKESDWESLYESSTRFYRSDKDVGLLPETDLQVTELESSRFVFVVVS